MATPVQKIPVEFIMFTMASRHRLLTIRLLHCPQTSDIYADIVRNYGVNGEKTDHFLNALKMNAENVYSVISDMSKSLFDTVEVHTKFAQRRVFVEVLHEDEALAEISKAFTHGTVTLVNKE